MGSDARGKITLEYDGRVKRQCHRRQKDDGVDFTRLDKLVNHD